jgi:cell wall-associated NlpC family hydrolase
MTARHNLIAATLGVALLAPFATQASATSVVGPDRNADVVVTSGRPASSSAFTGVATVTATGDDPLAGWAQTALLAVGTPSFLEQLDALATAIAERLWIEPARMQTAWRAADPQNQIALLAALTQLGVPYRSMRSNPGSGFDCSGLTSFAWKVAGKQLTRRSSDQIRAAERRTRDTAQAGDLVWYPGHVMMYLGVDTAIVHSPFSGRDVEVTYVPKRRANSVRYGDPAV